MQYFAALRAGQKRVASARQYLATLVGDKAMPALALRTGSDPLEPVGEETLFAFVDESSGFVLTDTSGHILALVDSQGYSKSIAQGIEPSGRAGLQEKLASDGVAEYRGKVRLPV